MHYTVVKLMYEQDLTERRPAQQPDRRRSTEQRAAGAESLGPPTANRFGAWTDKMLRRGQGGARDSRSFEVCCITVHDLRYAV